jgi:putative DNA primase/helicase
MGGDADMVEYLQKAVGYSLTGLTNNQCMFVMYGNGSNGKSTFIDVIKHMMNDYAGLAAAQTFAEKRDSQIPNDIAKLAGLRLVLSSEPKAGSVLEESLIKQATGDAQLTARYLNQEFFDFTPQFKLWMATNHKPIIKGTNHGIWRRVRLIPFEVTITDEEKIQGFDAILRGEVNGILRWAIEGLAKWLDAGCTLDTPGKVADATAAYRAEMDRLGEFFDDCCDLTDKSATCPGTDLYRVYVAWSKDREEDPMSQRAFSQVLQERGYRQAPSRADGRRWQAIRLTRQPPPSATDRQQSYANRWGRP